MARGGNLPISKQSLAVRRGNETKRRRGVPVGRPRIYSYEEIAAYYARGNSSYKTAEKFKCDRKTVRIAVREQGIRMRGWGGGGMNVRGAR